MEKVGSRSEKYISSTNEEFTDTCTSKDEDDALFHPSEGRLAYQGHIYQQQVLMLFLIRAYKQNYEVGIATEVKEAMQFDDLIFRLKDGNGGIKYRLMQVKLRQNEEKHQISYVDLLGITEKHMKSGFNLLQYISSYYKIRQNHKLFGEVKELFLYTNTNLNFKDIETHKVTFKQIDYDADDIWHHEVRGNKKPACYQIDKYPKEILLTFKKKHPDVTENDISEFLRLMRFAIHQPNRDDIEDLIRKELTETFGLFHSESMTDRLYCYMRKWVTSKRVEFLTNEMIREFFDNIKVDWQKIMLCGVTTDNLEKDLRFGDFFHDVSDANEWTDSRNAIVHITSSTGTTLPFIKIVQLLNNTLPMFNYAALDVGRLLCKCNDYISLLESNKLFILVVEINTLNRENEAKLHEFLKKYSSVRNEHQCLIILSVQNVFNFQSSVQKSYNECKFSELTLQTQERLLEKGVLFQDYYIPIKQILLQNYSDLLTVDVLNSLVSSGEMIVGAELTSIAEYENFYIPRKLSLCLLFGSECLTDISEQDLLIIINASETEILSLAPKEKVCDYHNESLSNGAARIIVMSEFKEEYYCEIKKYYVGKNLHLLKKNGEVFFWIISDNVTSECTEEDIPQQWGTTRMSIISGEAGLGKTNLMMHLAHRMKKLDPSSWIIYLPLREYSSLLSENDFSDSNRAIDFLKSILRSSFEQHLLTHRLMHCGKLSFLLDGLDELSQDNRNKILVLVDTLLKTKVERIWITTRSTTDFDLLKLADSLYLPLKFSVDDQKAYIRKFWRSRVDVINEEFLNTFIKDFVESFTESTHEYVKNMLTVPLRAKMAAELYQNTLEEARDHSESNYSVRFKKEIQHNIEFDLLKLYQQFVKKKFIDSFESGLEKKTLEQFLLRPLYRYHGEIALKHIFPSETEKWLGDLDEVMENEEHISRIGLARCIGEQWVFTHHTYCEYFAAYAIFDKLSKMKNRALPSTLSFLKKELFKISNDTVRKFLDYMTAEPSEVHRAAMNGHFDKIKHIYSNEPNTISNRDLLQRTPLHFAALYGHMESCIELITKDSSSISVKDIFGYGVICYAFISDKKESIQLLLSVGKNREDFNDTLKNVYRISTYRFPNQSELYLFLLISVDERQRSALVRGGGLCGGDESSKDILYASDPTTFQFKEIPDSYWTANNDQKWEMLSLNDCELLKTVLMKKYYEAILKMLALDAPIKAQIASLEEFKQAFELAVKHLDYLMLCYLQGFVSVTMFKELWQNSYLDFLRHVIENEIIDRPVNEVVCKIFASFTSETPMAHLNVNDYFKKLLLCENAHLSYVCLACLFKSATMEKQRDIFRAVEMEWRSSFKKSFESGSQIEFSALLNCIAEENGDLRKVLLDAIKYTVAFKDAIVENDVTPLSKLALCNEKEIEFMRQTLDEVDLITLLKQALLHKDRYMLTFYLTKFTYSSERKDVLSALHPIKHWDDNVHKGFTFWGDSEQFQKMASELDQIDQSEWSAWKRLFYVVFKHCNITSV